MPLPGPLPGFVLALAACGPAFADINVGVTVSATGPAASPGIPEKNTVALMPKTIARQRVNDIVLGSTTTPNSPAMIDVVTEAQVPMISTAASARIAEPQDAKKRWVFKTLQNDIMMSLAVVTYIANTGVTSAAFIGFADAYGAGWYQEFAKIAALKDLKVVASERHARTDTAVTGQVLKVLAAKPEAVLIAGSDTPAASTTAPGSSSPDRRR